PAMYFSDADKDIAEVSQISPSQVRSRMSASLDASVSDQMGLYYSTKRLDKQKDAPEDLDLIFGSINYAPKEVEKSTEEEKTSPELKGLRAKLKGNQTEKEKETENYMDIAFGDQKLLDYLSSKYEVDYLIFFNQFEIKTDYENCIDLQMRKYFREIKVHYTVVSKDGEKVSGDVITLPYHSNENDLSTIVRENFGEISDTLLKRIYLKK